MMPKMTRLKMEKTEVVKQNLCLALLQCHLSLQTAQTQCTKVFLILETRKNDGKSKKNLLDKKIFLHAIFTSDLQYT